MPLKKGENKRNNTNNHTIEMIQLKRDVIKKIVAGWSHQELVQWLCDVHKYEPLGAEMLLTRIKQAEKEKFSKYMADIAKKNYQRLNYIIDEAIEKGKNSDALAAIDKLNRMGGLYVQKVEVNSEKPVFEIKVQQ